MKPIIMGALALGGAGTIWALSRKKAPAKKKGKLDFKPAFQLHITKTAAGVPVKVATPVPTGATAEQKTATPSTPPLPPPPPKPPANPVASAAQSAVVQTAANVASQVASAAGAPVQVAAAVSAAPSLTGQISSQLGLQIGADSTPAYNPVPVIVPGQGVTFAPPNSIGPAPDGTVQAAPIVITPSGASSSAISSVLDVQRALNTLGIAPKLQETGNLDDATIANIKTFQSAHGLAVDGSAGPVVKAALSAALTQLASSNTPTPVAEAVHTATAGTPPSQEVINAFGPDFTPHWNEARKMRHHHVQHALNLLGASPPLPEDGDIDEVTVAAIKSFQLAHGLVADGIAGPKTKLALVLATYNPDDNADSYFGGNYGPPGSYPYGSRFAIAPLG